MMSDHEPTLDSELERILHEELGALLRRPDPSLEEWLDKVGNDPVTPDEDINHDGQVELMHTTIPAASGDEQLPVLICRPLEPRDGMPVVYYTANGGKVRQGAKAGVSSHETRWVLEHGITFVSISPRPGPIHRHPAQVEDAFAGLNWIAEHATDWGADPDKIILLGKSGGGGIAASTAIYARDHEGPPIARQMLIYPMLDDRAVTVSSTYKAVGWTSHLNRIGWGAILGDSAGGQDVSSYAAAAREPDLSGLPPAYIEVGSSEIFRDENLHYGMRLAEAGVPVELHSWMGGFHAFELVAPHADLSRYCLDVRASFLARAVRDLVGDEGNTGRTRHVPG